MEDSESEGDVAQMMGFSTFGGKPPAKRRKVKVDDASGANSTTLGIRQPRTTKSAQNESVESKEPNINISNMPSPSQPAGSAPQEDLDALVDQSNATSGPTRKKKKQATPTGLAGFLSRGQSITDTAPKTLAPTQAEESDRQFPTHQPQRNPTVPEYSDPAAPHPVLAKALEELNQQDFYELRKGVRGLNGEMIFFQQSFIEDPWARLRSGMTDDGT
jgi:hypothetical protein